MSSRSVIGSVEVSSGRAISRMPRRLGQMLALSLVLSAAGIGQSLYTVTAPVGDGTTTGIRVPNGLQAQAYHRSVLFIPGSELTGLPNRTAITHVGFTVTTGAGIPVIGRLRMYLLNTIRGASDLPAAWESIPASMPLLYDGPFTIPDSTGPLDVALSIPFVLTGPGVYIAYDFQSAGPFTTENLVVASSTALSSSIRSGYSATAPPAVLSDVSGFRPALRFRFPLPAFQWSSASLGTGESITALDVTDDTTAWASSDNGVMMRTTDRGASWSTAGSIGRPVSAIVGMTTVIGLAIGTDGSGAGVLTRTTDGGTTWNDVALGNLPSSVRLLGRTSTSAMVAVPDAVNDTMTVLRSTDRGASWRAATNPIAVAPGDSICEGTLCSVASSLWFVMKGSGGRIYQSLNGVGGPWVSHPMPTGNARSLAFSAVGGTGICGAVDTLYRTTDGGTSWQAIPMPGIGIVRTVQVFPGGVDFWIACSGGLWHSSDDGVTWTPSATVAGGYADLRFFTKFQNAIAAGANGLITRGTWVPPTTSVESPANGPVGFTLLASYPNPFNPSTTVEYILGAHAHVRLAVYDLLGQQIRLLADGPEAVGRHQVRWDGADDRGLDASTGIYFCRLTVDGNAVGLAKLILLR